jgi:S-adenosylmethionine-diacylglycerol 3-amino-3-carboxypropyl transferase
MPGIRRAVKEATRHNLGAAVHRHKPFSRRGLQERVFTFAFQQLVYPQIWEDPLVDLEALRLGAEDRVIAIASGGCNVLSYLTARPAEIVAVDLNGAHIALINLKLRALTALPDHEAFFAFFGRADRRENVAVYDARLRPGLDEATRAYWDGRGLDGRRRIEAFARGFYRHGLLGRFIGAGHAVARLYGKSFDALLSARSLEEQRAIFERDVAPLFDKRLVRWLVQRPSALYGLGIPPAQYRALAGDGALTEVLKRRVERLACDFPIADNYFAWQAFGRGYARSPDASLPPYLQRAHFDTVREGAFRVRPHHGSFTARLTAEPDRSFDAFVLLDAQDWMNDATLTELWREIVRTSRPGARVIFRTAADEPLLPGRVAPEILAQFHYEAERSRALGRRDRSSIYGAFHLWIRR